MYRMRRPPHLTLGFCRHNSLHEVRKQRYGKGGIAVRRTVDHALFDEPVTHRSDALDLDLEALSDIARPLGRVSQVCERAKVVLLTWRQSVEPNSEEIRIQSPYR